MVKHFVPIAFEIRRDDQTGENVEMAFFGGQDEERRIVMARNQIARFVTHLLAEADVSLDTKPASEASYSIKLD